MKKLLLSIIFFTIVIATQAQITGGAKAGFTMSTYSGDKIDGRKDEEWRPGFHFGMYFNFKLNNKLSFQPELLLSTGGSKWVEIIELDNSELVRLDITQKLGFLTMPLNLMLSFGNFNIHAGPQLSFLLKADDMLDMTRVSGGNVIQVTGIARDAKYLNGVDMGFNVGAGFNFGKLGVGARYYLGMRDFADAEGASDEDYKITNDMIQVSILYKLLDNTVYSASKRKHFEYLILGELNEDEYLNFQQQFKRDRIDPITQKGVGNMGETWNHINQIMKDKDK